MIQFNLLPDVKLEFVRTQRLKRVVLSIAVIASAGAFTLFLLLFLTVHVVQAKIIRDQTGDIKTYAAELKNTPNLDKILTVQNQLGALTGLHAAKPAASRSFGYLQQVTPDKVAISEATFDYVAHTVEISGVSPTFDLVNTMVDTLKYATYTSGDIKDKAAFSGVEVSDFTRTTKSSTFTIKGSYDPVIFDNAQTVSLTVPPSITSSSVLNQPTTFTKSTTGTNN